MFGSFCDFVISMGLAETVKMSNLYLHDGNLGIYLRMTDPIFQSLKDKVRLYLSSLQRHCIRL